MNHFIPCPLTGKGHHWSLTYYERYISRGKCSCGAIQFFAESGDEDVIKRVKILNKKHGKEGKAMAVAGKPRPISKEEQGEEQPVPEKAPVGELEPVPPKPKGSTWEIREYYNRNKEAIVRDYQTLGFHNMMKRWGISYATWLCKRKDGTFDGLAVRFGLVPGGEKRVKEKPAALEEVKAIDRESGEEVTVRACPECHQVVTGEGLGHKKGCPLATKRKKIPSDTEVNKDDHGEPKNDAKVPKGNPILAVKTLVIKEDNNLPEFPEFKDSWSTTTQVEWLQTYRELAKR